MAVDRDWEHRSGLLLPTSGDFKKRTDIRTSHHHRTAAFHRMLLCGRRQQFPLLRLVYTHVNKDSNKQPATIVHHKP